MEPMATSSTRPEKRDDPETVRIIEARVKAEPDEPKRGMTDLPKSSSAEHSNIPPLVDPVHRFLPGRYRRCLQLV